MRNPHLWSYGAHFWIPTFVGKSELIDLANVRRMQSAIHSNTPCSNVCGLRPLFPPPFFPAKAGIQRCLLPKENRSQRRMVQRRAQSASLFVWRTFLDPDFRREERVDRSNKRRANAIRHSFTCNIFQHRRVSPSLPSPVLSGESRNPGTSASQSKLKSATDGARLCAIRTLVHIPYISGPRLSPG